MIKNIYVQYSEFSTLFFRASHQLLKGPERQQIIQRNEKFHGNAVLQSKKVVQISE